MARYSSTLRDTLTQAPIEGAWVLVQASGDGSKAVLTDDEGDPLDNPFTTDRYGSVVFNTNDGAYDLSYVYGGRTVLIDRNTLVGASATLPLGAIVNSFGPGTIVAASQALVTQFTSSVGSALVGFIQAGTGAVARTAQAKMREVVSITDYGAVANSGADVTVALNRAIAALGATGGEIEFPIGTWALNGVIAQDNITLVGRGGRGEFDRVCLRPFDLTKPTLTFGDDVTDWRYCGVTNLHISGSDGTTDGVRKAAHNAPQALLLKGGTVNFKAINCTFYNGIQTVALIPSLTNPVTANTFLCCTIRNDLDDTDSARSIYGIRQSTPDGGYWTANKFIATKVNGPILGYAAEYDGTSYPILAEINDCYWDIRPGHGILCKGSVTLVMFNLQLDPGASNVVIIESDQALGAGGIDRLLLGSMRHGGQKVQFSGGVTVDLPPSAETFGYRAAFEETALVGNNFLTVPTNPYDNTVYFGRVGANIMFSGAPVVGDQGFSSNTDYRIAGTKVVGVRQSGWTTMAGTATKGGFDTSTVTLPQLAQVVKALIDERLAAGSIGA